MKKILFLMLGLAVSFYVSAQAFQISDLCDILPETANVEQTGIGAYGTSSTYLKVDVTNGGMLNGEHEGWCVDTENGIPAGEIFDANVYCSYETLPDGLIDKPYNLDLANWVLNNVAIGQESDCGNGNYTFGDIQRALWYLVDNDNSESGLGNWDETECRALEIVANAEANGEGYEPGVGEYAGVIFDPGEGTQTVLIPVMIICEEECAECDGGVTSLDLAYFGASTANTIEVYKDDVKDDKLFATFTNVAPGDVISFVGPDSDNKMGSKIRIVVDGDEDNYTEIHTSCSQAIYVGFVKDDFMVVAGSSKDGGAFCEDYSSECDGGVTSLDLQYQGATTANTIEVYKDDVKDDKLFATFTNVDPGDVISFVGPDDDGKMGSKIRIVVNGQENDYTEIHTSCSQAIYIGLLADDFEVVGGTSLKGGPLPDCGECDGGVTSLDLEILANVSGATIRVYKDDVKDDKLFATFTGKSQGDIISFVGPDSDNKMGSKIFLTINSTNEDDAIEIHTSCSQDIFVGSTYDNTYEVTAGLSKDGGPLCPIYVPGLCICDECDGGVTSLDLVFLADFIDATVKVYTNDVKDDELFATFVNVNMGDLLSFVGPESDNKMGSKIFLTINDNENTAIEIHTSCSQDIYAGMTFGNTYFVKGGTSKDGGRLCAIEPIEEGDCAECKGGVTALELEILADVTNATVRVYQGDKANEDDLFYTSPLVSMGDVISFVGPESDNKMGTKIFLTIDNGYGTEIHTSCSQDIFVGSTFNGNYLVLGGSSKDGGLFCPLPEGGDCAECKGGITSLDLELIQTGLTDATVTVYNKEVGGDIIITGTYSTGDIISFVGPESDNGMDNNIYLTINDDDDNAVNIHTSCSQPVYIGIEFDYTYRVLGGTSKDGGFFCDCNECDGGITSLELEIIADVTNATVTVYNGDVGDDIIISEVVSTGDVISFVGPESDGRMDNNISLTFTVNGNEGTATEIHTSCSQDIWIGSIFDNRYLVTGGTSKDGGPFCEDPNKSSSIETQRDISDVAVYPNPISNIGTVEFIAAKDGQATVEIYDIVGKRVAVLFEGTVQADSRHKVTFNSTNLRKGMYIVIVRNESAIYKQKLSVVK